MTQLQKAFLLWDWRWNFVSSTLEITDCERDQWISFLKWIQVGSFILLDELASIYQVSFWMLPNQVSSIYSSDFRLLFRTKLKNLEIQF